MPAKLIVTLLLLLTGSLAQSQLAKRLRYAVDAGVGVSVGPSVFTDKASVNNPWWGVGYYSTERYRFPSLRVRAAVLYAAGKRLAVGLRSGADVIYGEYNAYGQRETYAGIPVQAIAQIQALRLGESRSLFVGVGAGYKTRSRYESGFKKRGGLLLSAELSVGATAARRSVYYRLGAEYARENLSVALVPLRPVNFTPETMHLITARKLAFVAIGYAF